MAWTVGEAANLARISVRTLHHYDKIGLLRPSERSDSGYRLYGADELEQLHQILVFRELGFSLDEIRKAMLDSAYDRLQALREQRALLKEKARRTEKMIAAIETAIASTEKGTIMSDEERSEMFKELFDGFDPAEYEEEVEERWGGSDAYKQSAERTKRYTKADWERIKEDGLANINQFLAAMDAGLPPDSPEAMQAAAGHHAYIEKWFYDAPLDMYGCLAEMWVADERFKKNIDKTREGLAEYQRDSVKAWIASRKS
ncbi:MAG: MerR family transcriptional regulator [Candidatus Aquicultorales bacterium]